MARTNTISTSTGKSAHDLRRYLGVGGPRRQVRSLPQEGDEPAPQVSAHPSAVCDIRFRSQRDNFLKILLAGVLSGAFPFLRPPVGYPEANGGNGAAAAVAVGSGLNDLYLRCPLISLGLCLAVFSWSN